MFCVPGPFGLQLLAPLVTAETPEQLQQHAAALTTAP